MSFDGIPTFLGYAKKCMSSHSRNGFPDANVKRILGACLKTLRKPQIPAA